MQLDKLAFYLAPPALHRKLNFALRLKHGGWVGGSVDVPLDQGGTSTSLTGGFKATRIGAVIRCSTRASPGYQCAEEAPCTAGCIAI